jgi:pyridoxamine 5'-phosphate oxidase
VPDREWLEEKMRETTERFPGGEVPIPPAWGGYRVKPRRIEFWQGRRSRLHDRLLYTRNETDGDSWRIERLSP